MLLGILLLLSLLRPLCRLLLDVGSVLLLLLRPRPLGPLSTSWSPVQALPGRSRRLPEVVVFVFLNLVDVHRVLTLLLVPLAVGFEGGS